MRKKRTSFTKKIKKFVRRNIFPSTFTFSRPEIRKGDAKARACPTRNTNQYGKGNREQNDTSNRMRMGAKSKTAPRYIIKMYVYIYMYPSITAYTYITYRLFKKFLVHTKVLSKKRTNSLCYE